MNFIYFLMVVIGGMVGFLSCAVLAAGKESEREYRLSRENEVLRIKIGHLRVLVGKLQRKNGT